MRRSFTLVEGRHYKFWTVQVVGCHYLATFGRINSKGQTQVKTFGHAHMAMAEADKMIREKTRKGYVQAEREYPGASAELLASLQGTPAPAPVTTEEAPEVYRKIRRDV